MSTDQIRSEALAQFLNMVPDADPEKAQNFLEMSDWDPSVAIETYYDNLEDNNQNNNNNSTDNQNVPKQGQGAWPTAQSSRDKIRTFNEISEPKEGEETPGQDLFAGGEKSGTAIRYPGLPDNVNSMLEGLFSRINQPRAPSEDEPDSPEASEPTSVFKGIGARVGDPSEPSSSSTIPCSFPEQSAAPRGEVVIRNLSLWRNGLTLEDGPLITYESPEGKQLMQAVSSGLAPLNLLGVQPGQKVDVHVHRKLDEDYTPPPVSLRPFTGTGNRLGSIVPSTVSAMAATESAASESKPAEMEVDPSKPQTSLQIRLADGSRLVAKFNHDHTVSDIHEFIMRSRPQGQSNFYLQSSFPVKIIEDKSLTIAKANLLNSVVFQKFR